MDTAEVEEVISPEEELFSLIAKTINGISGTNITPSSEMVDVLLDISNLVTKIEEGANAVTAQYLRTLFLLAYYEEKYGVERPDKDWKPSTLAHLLGGE